VIRTFASGREKARPFNLNPARFCRSALCSYSRVWQRLNAVENNRVSFFLNYERTGAAVIPNLRFFKTNMHFTSWKRPKF